MPSLRTSRTRLFTFHGKIRKGKRALNPFQSMTGQTMTFLFIPLFRGRKMCPCFLKKNTVTSFPRFLWTFLLKQKERKKKDATSTYFFRICPLRLIPSSCRASFPLSALIFRDTTTAKKLLMFMASITVIYWNIFRLWASPDAIT